MTRSYASDDIIQLPVLSADGAVAMGTEIDLLVKEETKLPALVKKRGQKLLVALTALRGAVKATLPDGSTSPEARAADRLLDAAWGAISDWATGWSRLPASGKTAKYVTAANTLIGALLPDGLKFTQLQYKLEWSQSQARIETIGEKKLDDAFELLGGKPLLDNLRAAHAHYGEVLGLTAVKSAPKVANLREPLTSFQAALRGFITAVTAHEDDEDPGSVEMAERLLAPIKSWAARHADPASSGATGSAPAGPSGATGGTADGAGSATTGTPPSAGTPAGSTDPTGATS
jgi:hypothetical protein